MSLEQVENNRSPVTAKLIEGRATVAELFSPGVRFSRVQPALIDLMSEVAGRIGVKELLEHYGNERFTEPSHLSQRQILALEGIMYTVAPTFYDSLVLSPVAPLGTNNVLTQVSQKSVVSALREVEVIADPTTLLVLETAKRWKNDSRLPGEKFSIDTTTSTRCVRAQTFSKESGFLPHFQVFAMTSGGVLDYAEMDRKAGQEHLATYLGFLDATNSTGGYLNRSIHVSISNINIMEELIDSYAISRKELGRHSQDSSFDPFATNGINLPNTVSDLDEVGSRGAHEYGISRHIDAMKVFSLHLREIRERFPHVTFDYDLARIAGIGYYNGICFKVTAQNAQGDVYPLVDGGYSDWLGRLVSNNKARFFSSGFGLELYGNLFNTTI